MHMLYIASQKTLILIPRQLSGYETILLHEQVDKVPKDPSYKLMATPLNVKAEGRTVIVNYS